MREQTLHVVRALRQIGLPRNAFSARCPIDRRTGEPGQAVGHIWNRRDAAVVIQNIRPLIDAGLNVHVVEHLPGKERAFVTTPAPGRRPVLIRYAEVITHLNNHQPKE